MLQNVEQLCCPSLKNTSEVSRNQRPADRCEQIEGKTKKTKKKKHKKTQRKNKKDRTSKKQKVHISSSKLSLTISFGAVFQTESDCEHGVILKKLCSEGIPPEVVTVLKAEVD